MGITDVLAFLRFVDSDSKLLRMNLINPIHGLPPMANRIQSLQYCLV